jgi:hypothetical protein
MFFNTSRISYQTNIKKSLISKGQKPPRCNLLSLKKKKKKKLEKLRFEAVGNRLPDNT